MNPDPTSPSSRKPPRAEPVQPDKPGSGNSTLDPADDAPRQGQTHESAKRQKQQSDTALDNVRKGYD